MRRVRDHLKIKGAKLAAGRRLLTALMAFFLLLPSLSPFTAGAADPPTTIPGFSPFGDGVSINYLISGEVDPNELAAARVIVERIDLDTGDIAPSADAIQLVAVQQGRLVMVDDLGLTASLKAGKQTFAPAGAFTEIKAAEPTEFLRARIAAPKIDITITDEACLLNTQSLSPDDNLTVENRTDVIQDFKIRTLNIDVNIPVGEIVEIPLSGAEAGDVVVMCGRNQRTSAPIDNLTLTISEGASTPVTTSQSVTVLFDGLIQSVSAARTTFSLTELALAAAGSLGEQTIPGPTGIVAGDESLQIERPGKPKATLDAGGQVLLPAETVATISNAGDSPTTMLVVSLLPIVEATPAQPTADPEPTATSPTGESQSDTADLEAFLPSSTDLRSIGLTSLRTLTVDSVEDTSFTGLESIGIADNWQNGIISICQPIVDLDDVIQAQISIDQFDTPLASATMFSSVDASASNLFTVIDPPLSSNASQVLAYSAEHFTAEGFSAVFIIGYYGAVFVTVTVYTLDPNSVTAANVARELWMAVDATR